MVRKRTGRKKKLTFGAMTGRLRRRGYSKKSSTAIAGAIRMQSLGKYKMKHRGKK
jgi:hypothetical protein